MIWRGILLLSVLNIGVAQDKPSFESSVTLVHVDVAVESKEGRTLTGLSEADFRVIDEGQRENIVAFAADEQPVDLILLFDISGSLRAKITKVASAADQALAELRTGDRVAVLAFNTHTTVISPFTANPELTRRAIQQLLQIHFGGGTLIQEAVDDAAIYMLQLRRTDRRRGVLIVTDNLGLKTRKELSVIRDYWEADAVLSGFLLINPVLEKRRHNLRRGLRERIAGMEHIAEQTGGETIRSDEPNVDFAEVLHRLRSRYSLYYRAPGGSIGSYRHVQVELTDVAKGRFPDARISARRGYWVRGM